MAIAEGTGSGGDEAASLKATSSLACRRSGVDRMLDFMKMFVSTVLCNT